MPVAGAPQRGADPGWRAAGVRPDPAGGGGLLHLPGAGVLAVWSAVVTGFAGILLQLILLPALMAALKKGGLLRE